MSRPEEDGLLAMYRIRDRLAMDAEQPRDDAGRFSEGSGGSRLEAVRNVHGAPGHANFHTVHEPKHGTAIGHISGEKGVYNGQIDHPKDNTRTLNHGPESTKRKVLAGLARKHAEASK